MTPLAARLIRGFANPQDTRPQMSWKLGDPLYPGVYKGVDLDPSFVEGFHYFEVSAVLDEAQDLAFAIADGDLVTQELMFLPAGKIWIEFKPVDDERQALIVGPATPGSGVLELFHCVREPGPEVHVVRTGLIFDPETFLSDAHDDFMLDGEEDEGFGGLGFHAWLCAFLVLINSPKVIGRRQVMPHRGIQKAIAGNRRLSGRFPLRAYTELVLHTGPVVDKSSDQPTEARLSGHRCLHFVRAHLRLVGGVLRKVSAHWRGDRSLGIKRTRYRLEPTQGGEHR